VEQAVTTTGDMYSKLHFDSSVLDDDIAREGQVRSKSKYTRLTTTIYPIFNGILLRLTTSRRILREARR
jgi:hypothetical protein